MPKFDLRRLAGLARKLTEVDPTCDRSPEPGTEHFRGPAHLIIELSNEGRIFNIVAYIIARILYQSSDLPYPPSKVRGNRNRANPARLGFKAPWTLLGPTQPKISMGTEYSSTY